MSSFINCSSNSDGLVNSSIVISLAFNAALSLLACKLAPGRYKGGTLGCDHVPEFRDGDEGDMGGVGWLPCARFGAGFDGENGDLISTDGELGVRG